MTLADGGTGPWTRREKRQMTLVSEAARMAARTQGIYADSQRIVDEVTANADARLEAYAKRLRAGQHGGYHCGPFAGIDGRSNQPSRRQC